MTIHRIPPQLLSDAGLVALIPVSTHAAGQTVEAWVQNSKFSADWSVGLLNRRFGNHQLTRSDLFQLGEEARNGCARRSKILLTATLIWGNSKIDGRGNSSRAIESSKNGNHIKTYASTNSLRSAYVEFSRGGNCKVDGYDVSFFTKYLYFLNSINREWVGPRPLIFDSQVSKTLFGKKTTYSGTWITSDNWEWIPQYKSGVGLYLEYCISLDAWANQLSQAGTLVSPDQIERYLFGG